MKNYRFENIDADDLTDFITQIEKSFHIEFGKTELIQTFTLNQFINQTINKIQLDNVDNCTSQQAFYKLKNAFSTTLNVEITTDTLLEDVLPRNNRRQKVAELESELGFQLNILRPPFLFTYTLVFLLLISLGLLFFKWQLGLLGILISSVGIWISNQFANEFNLETTGQVAEKMMRENYLLSRRNLKTFNKNEVEELIENWFVDEFVLN